MSARCACAICGWARPSRSVTLAGGALTARLDPITLYGGTGQAELDVDGRGAVPTFRNRLKFERVALQPFLNDTLGVGRIEGTGSLTLDVAAQGTNANAVMHSLSGKWLHRRRPRPHPRRRSGRGGAHDPDACWAAARPEPSASTDYLAMDGSFVIASGVLTNKDFRLAGPVLSMTGAGDIDIGNRAIDFRLVPKGQREGREHRHPVPRQRLVGSRPLRARPVRRR